MESISLIPTWRVAADIYIMAFENGTPDGRSAAKQGIREMADALDEQNRKVKLLVTALRERNVNVEEVLEKEVWADQ